MLGIVRLYHDSYGNNMGSRTFCQLSKYFGGVLITDNKKIKAMDEFKSITHREALDNIDKFTKLLVYNTKPNMFGGIAPKHTPEVVRLIQKVPNLYFYNCDPILDLQKSVPSSHERAVPGLTSAIHRLNNFCTRLDRTNTDLTKFLAGRLKDKIVDLEGAPKKEWVGCYFGNARLPERQKQVFELLNPLKSRLIIGHKHEQFAWFDYTPDFYHTLSTAWVTPIIGDQKLHYETKIPSLRLYEACCSTAIVLIDSRLYEPLLDERFYFSTAEEFHKKAKMISENRDLYNSMLGKQRGCIKKVIREFGSKQFNWTKIRKQKEQQQKEVRKQIELKKQIKRDKARQRLIAEGLIQHKTKK